MAESIKVLGQVSPGATTETTLYTVPAATSAVISNIQVCNRAASAGTFRISISVGGGATANKDYLYFDANVPANDSVSVTIGATVGAADVIRVYASSASQSFTAFGTEVI